MSWAGVTIALGLLAIVIAAAEAGPGWLLGLVAVVALGAWLTRPRR